MSKEAEQKLSTILQFMAEAIVVLGRDGNISECNPAAELMFGYSANELKGSNVKILMPVPYYGEYDKRIANNQAAIPGRIVNKLREYSGLRKDGTIFPIEIMITEIDHLDAYIAIIRDISKQRALEKELADMSSREQEKIGRELHDGIGQQLTALSMLASSLKKNMAKKNAPEMETLDVVIAQLKEAAEEVRRISHGLAPITITPEGLQDALARLANSVAGNGEVQCRYVGDASISIDDQDVANHLYRIAQEAFNNALKYAQAKNILITLCKVEPYIELCVSDDGHGFISSTHTHHGGSGLRVIHYRAKVIGAQMYIDSIPKLGTRLRCRLSTSRSVFMAGGK